MVTFGPPDRVDAYVALMRAYVDGRLQSAEFEVVYLALFKSDPALREPSMYDALATTFHAIDDYWPGESLDQQDAAEIQLRQQVRRALEDLESVLALRAQGDNP
ncbi:MAG: Bacterial self-protective colicin-like immunity [Schumannella sp.]|nr:Bacterial self-protective colicin-like immunity [Schumannella sp.]